jgi:glycosyltransferase involved in cell wall biosynthesis
VRILMLTQFYPPIIGGEERHVRSLSTQLVARGHEVSVATIWHPGMPELEVDQGVRIHRIRGTMQRIDALFSDSGHKHAPPFPDPELTLALRRVVSAGRPQIVHAHNWLVYSFLPLKGWSGSRLVLTVHDHSLLCPNKKLIYQEAHCSGPGFAKCLRCAGSHYGGAKGAMVMAGNRVMTSIERAGVDMFVPVSRAVAQDNRLFERRLPVEVIPNFVPDDIGVLGRDPRPELDHLPAGDFMLFVGAFGRYKGLDVLIRAYAGLRSAPPLVVIGYQTSEFPVLTTDMPPNVLVLKNWPHEAVMQAWSRSLFGLVPSTWSDPCPTTALEAMATSRPLIASRIGGLTAMVDEGVTGLLVSPADEEALRHAMARLLADPALRERMGEAAKRKVVEFQAGSVVPRIEQLYRRLLSDGHADRRDGCD